jgi:hypothetical protein
MGQPFGEIVGKPFLGVNLLNLDVSAALKNAKSDAT